MKVKVAQISSVCLPVPPPSHGGTEWMVHLLCEGLESRGHEVHLFASGDSNSSGTLHAVAPQATLMDPETTTYLDKEFETRNTWNLYRQGDRFDILHGHWPCLAMYFSDAAPIPTVLTYAYIERHLHEFYRQNFPKLHPVCISRRQAELLGEPDLPVVYNGIDLAQVPFGDQEREGLLIAGRIVPNKGIAEAIEVARRAGERLTIVGDTTPYLPWSDTYFRERVEPHIDGDRVVHIRNLHNRDLLNAMSRSRAFLFPLQWEEPFGLVVAEAMATGTPVLTLPKGSMPELVCDGETGFLCESLEDLVRSVQNVDRLDAHACREHVDRSFSVDRMVEEYLALYRSLAGAETA